MKKKCNICAKLFEAWGRQNHCSEKCYSIHRKEYYKKRRQSKESKEYFKRYNASPKMKAYFKSYKESKKFDYWIVYELPCGYIGQTNQPEIRMRKHKDANKRITEGYKTLAICYCKDEALDLEALYQTLSNSYNKPDNNKLNTIR